MIIYLSIFIFWLSLSILIFLSLFFLIKIHLVSYTYNFSLNVKDIFFSHLKLFSLMILLILIIHLDKTNKYEVNLKAYFLSFKLLVLMKFNFSLVIFFNIIFMC